MCPIWEYENAEILLKAFLSAGLVELAIRHSGEDKVRSAMLNAIEPLQKEDGSFLTKNTFIYVIATNNFSFYAYLTNSLAPLSG